MDLKGKRVWITGGSSGLGEALAYAFAKKGANLILTSRKRKELDRVKANCSPDSQVHVEVLDMMEHDKIPVVAARLLKELGTIDIVINNAGISQRGLAKDTALEVDKRIMSINYFGVVALTKALLPSMLANQSGHIVAVSSLVGKFGSPLRSTYAASKHALHGFFDSLRAEVVKDNIKVMLICPGYIHTNISKNAVTGDGSAQNTMDEKTAAGLSPQEFARQAVEAIQKGKQEVLIGKKETYGVLVKRLFPRLFAKILTRVKVT
ncbi:MAG: SDR family oxidoreductase [Bacteroidota bacterium]